jgi:hypothetical protein
MSDKIPNYFQENFTDAEIMSMESHVPTFVPLLDAAFDEMFEALPDELDIYFGAQPPFPSNE